MAIPFLQAWRNRFARTYPLFLYNTLGMAKQEFTLPTPAKTVRMYNCGPTVYDTQHIGNLSMFVFADVLKRTLEYNSFSVKQVINITDVGHLTSDADEGEDKMTKGLRREKKKPTLENMRELGERYTQIFLDDLGKLNIDTARIIFPRASDFLPAQIAMVQTLQEKGYAYVLSDGVYFDTSRFPAYGALGGIHIETQKEGARIAVHAGKHNPADFVLWKLDKKLGWESPWGKGFPGWHIECSAMIRATLGEQIDIHTGGIEHVGVHHNNEIAQSEAVTGRKPFSRFWMHRAHVQLEGGKLAKSKGNVVYLSEIIDKGFHPLALRYLFLGAHYRTPSNFTWGALLASQTAFAKLVALRLSLTDVVTGVPSPQWREKFTERINDDLDTPGALAVLWDMVKDASLAPAQRLGMLLDADKVLGLNLKDPDEKASALGQAELRPGIPAGEIRPEILKMIEERGKARTAKDYEKADALRREIEKAGFGIDDAPGAPKVYKK